MKKICLVLVLVLISQNVDAASTATSSPTSSTKMLLSPGLAFPLFLDSGETGGGLSSSFLWQIEPNSRLYAGADLGLHFWGKALSTTESSTALQLCPSALYLFGSKSSLVPFVGVSAGAYWWVAQATGMPGIDFMLLFRPGLMIQMSQSMSFNVVANYGSIGGAFLLMPTLGVNITL